MISMDKKYRTRDGRDVRVLSLDGAPGLPVVGVIDGQNEPYGWSLDGRFRAHVGNSSGNQDLIEVRSAEDVVREALAYPVAHDQAYSVVRALREAGLLREDDR